MASKTPAYRHRNPQIAGQEQRARNLAFLSGLWIKGLDFQLGEMIAALRDKPDAPPEFGSDHARQEQVLHREPPSEKSA